MPPRELIAGVIGATAGILGGVLIGRGLSSTPASTPSPTAPSGAVSLRFYGQSLIADKGGAGSMFTSAPHPALRHGMPLAQNLRMFKQYVTSFDSRTRNPQWVLEHVSKSTSRGDGDRQGSKFFEDQDIPVRLRNRLDDFKGSGYDRGHLAPAANHGGSQEAMNETFSLSNMSPQVGKGFNRSYWARFEKFVRDLTRECDDVYVVTGPLYLPSKTRNGWTLSHPMIGQPPSMVAVPTHFFKVVLAEYDREQGKKAQALGAFVIPNAEIDGRIPLSTWIVPVEDLEAAAGMQFFTSFLTPCRRHALAEAEHVVLDQLGRAGAPSKILTDGTTVVSKPKKGSNTVAIRASPRGPATEVLHLCERARCELVSEDWAKHFNSDNPPPQVDSDSSVVIDEDV